MSLNKPLFETEPMPANYKRHHQLQWVGQFRAGESPPLLLVLRAADPHTHVAANTWPRDRTSYSLTTSATAVANTRSD